MKKNHILPALLALATTAAAHAPAAAAGCSVDLAVIPVEQIEDVPDAVSAQLSNRLINAATATGVAAGARHSRFYITGKFSHILEDVVPGPPAQTALYTTLTLYIGDSEAGTVFATASFDLRGVGTSTQRAFINAMKPINAKNANFAAFVQEGRQKIIDYYDANYDNIIKTAEQDIALHNYAEALLSLTAVPACSKGYDKASKKAIKLFDDYKEILAKKLLTCAQAEWAVSPDSRGAARAFGYIILIDPETTAYTQADSLIAEMKEAVKDDYIFETRDKYDDDIDLERSRIEAIRDVCTAIANGQAGTAGSDSRQTPAKPSAGTRGEEPQEETYQTDKFI